ncbi:T9SS type A sorting domain-containing protein [Flavivirga rizhaonensis]|uniref:T9SS type A sorting domain-containing protein n=1 Tax=Flavivirga rizhaonensis TaxID=2559571 RepID=A0A4S1E228_9FLAO|nr:T9SS type A sorting domain-containing protein [Flavivirga rizhaonensis]TGV04771.1 T9SS type A sorting domain-containing protein [Flavivirga rizhaonensis]
MKKITTCLSVVLMAIFVNTQAQTVYINEDFQDTDISAGTVSLASGFAKYNYTADTATPTAGEENWANSPSTADKTNSVSIHSRSGSAQFVAADVSGQQALRMNGGANYLNANAGIYFTGLDLTGQTSLYFEFEIWGAPVAGDTDIPATLQSWSINLNFGNSSTGFDLSDSFFNTGPNVMRDVVFDITNGTTNPTNQTSFDIVDGQWIKISGTVDLSGVTPGSFGALQVQTDTGGFVSGGTPIYAIDNVFVSNQVPLSNSSFELANSIKIYPNPVNSELNIDSAENINIKELNLINVLGKTVYTAKNVNQIDVSNFAKGMYILKVTSSEKGVLNKKVIIN